MNFFEFREYMCLKLRDRLGAGYDIKCHDATKINQTRIRGIIIMNSKSRIFPVIYLEDIYNRVSLHDLSLEDAVEEVYGIYLKESLADEFEEEIEIERLKDWKNIKHLVRARLVATAYNHEFLAETPHVAFCNLSVVFYVELPMDEGSAGISITHKLMEVYGQTVESLYKQAVENIKPELVKFKNIKQMIEAYSGTECKDKSPYLKAMYVLTNTSNTYGVSLILAPWVQELILNMYQCPVYLLPSSVHEWIVLPATEEEDAAYLASLVKDVNLTVVRDTDFLSSNVYLLDEKKEIRIAA